MKVKKTVLFEQGAYPEPRFDENYKFDHNEVGFYSFEPHHHDDFVYVNLVEYGDGRTILIEKVVVDKEVVINSAKVMPEQSQPFENIRVAIAEFDSLLANHPMTWVKGSRAVEEKNPEVNAEDELPF